MKVTFHVYRPPQKGLPFLAVGFSGDYAVAVRTAKTKAEAEALLDQVRKRAEFRAFYDPPTKDEIG